MPEQVHTRFSIEPPTKKQKIENGEASLAPKKKRRTAPSQVRRNLERAKLFKEKNGVVENSSAEPNHSSDPTVPLPLALQAAPAQSPQSSQQKKQADGGPRKQAGAGPPPRRESSTAKAARAEAASELRKDLRATAASLLRTRKSLPIATHEKAIREALRRHDVLVLVGETGSGKSTQLPQVLQSEAWCRQTAVPTQAESSSRPDDVAGGASPARPARYIGGCVAVTQPRRVAATTLARRVAREMGSPLGRASPASKVGYCVRFDDNCGPRTRIKYLTDGMLLQELLRDPSLTDYSAVVVDEVHERGVNVDLLLGFLKRLVTDKEVRGGLPLKVVVMSATADAEGFVKFFSSGLDGADNDREEVGANSIVTGGEAEPIRAAASPDTGLKMNVLQQDHLVSTLEVGGRQHPVRIVHVPRPVQDILEAALLKIFELNFREPLPGDILVFMTGQGTVESLCHLIHEYSASLSKSVPQLLALPLYAALPQEAQQRVFDPIPPPLKGQRWTRKVIVSTNIAETSVTIPGVRHVVDGGKEKVKQYRPAIGLESLLTQPVSQSAAVQRAGRAGREAPGSCYRLYCEADFRKLAGASVPEILRSDLSQAYLFLLARGVTAAELGRFPLIAQPSRAATEAALVQLHRLGAVDDGGRVTQDGKLMAGLPVSAAMARVLLHAASPQMDCLDDAIDLVSAMSGEEIFTGRREGADVGGRGHNEVDDGERGERGAEAGADERGPVLTEDLRRSDGDHAAMVRAVRGFADEQADRRVWAKDRGLSWRALREIMRIRKQLQGLAPRLRAHNEATPGERAPGGQGADGPAADGASANLLRCLLAGFPANVALLDADNRYRTPGGRQEIAVHPSSALHARANQSIARKAATKPAAIVYSEFVFTSRAYAKGVSAVDVGMVLEAIGRPRDE